MHADLQGALNQLGRSYRWFTHNGNPMTKDQVRAVLEYGIEKGYKTTKDLSDQEIEDVLLKLQQTQNK